MDRESMYLPVHQCLQKVLLVDYPYACGHSSELHCPERPTPDSAWLIVVQPTLFRPAQQAMRCALHQVSLDAA